MKMQNVKGFKDYLPAEALKRQFVVQKIIQVFQKFGFDPLETPAMEYAETLEGKYGEEERLIYKFETPGGDRVALKYDQTVPLARVVAQYGPRGEQKLPIPFKRYQIQSAFRGENPQRGRYREFIQCDVDIIGINSPLVDAELLAVAYEAYNNLGLEVVIKVNDRSVIADIEPKYLAALDKSLKIGKDGVIDELKQKGLNINDAEVLYTRVSNQSIPSNLNQTMELFYQMGYPEGSLEFDPMLIRGLDYYTGIIMEVVLKDSPLSSSLGGGGRYDKMIGKFTGVDLPANGFSMGLDRTIEAMEGTGVIGVPATKTKVLVSVFSKEYLDQSLKVAFKIRSMNVNTEVWLEADSKLDKQLKYADQKGIPFVVILGPDEAESGVVTLKDLNNKVQEKITLDEVVEKLSS